jgi:hypothetical protein
MRFLRSATLCAAAFSLAAAPFVLAKEAEPLKISNKGALKGASQIAIAAFNVGFIFESTDATKASGGLMGAFGGTTKAQSKLVGVSPAMMQQITDAAYADFVKQMTARGFRVMEPGALFADPNFAKIKVQTAPTDINIALENKSKGKATYYKPGALAKQVMIGTDFVGSGLSSMGLMMSAGQNGYLLGTYAKAANTPVVDVTYLIDFSQQKRPGAFSFGGLKVNAALSVSPTYSKVTVIGPNGNQDMLTLGQPVSVEGEFIDMKDASSGFDKTSQAVGNVAGGVAAAFGMGGFGFGKTRKFEFTAKPGNYEQGATKVASLANELVSAQLSAMK